MTEFEQKEVQEMNLKQGTMNIFIAAMQTDRNMLSRNEEQLEEICQKCRMIAEKLMGETATQGKHAAKPAPAPKPAPEKINVVPAAGETSLTMEMVQIFITSASGAITQAKTEEEVTNVLNQTLQQADTYRKSMSKEDWNLIAEQLMGPLNELTSQSKQRKLELSQVSAA